MEDNPHQFGSQIPFAEPAWYDERNRSPFYNESHVEFRAKIRKWVDEEVIPNVDEWEKNGIPRSAFKRAGELGVYETILGWPEGLCERPSKADQFHRFIATDEICRAASAGISWGLIGGPGIGAPPIVHYGTDEMKERVLKPVLRGEKTLCLAVSEAGAGSDVASLATTAKEDGGDYVIEGMKKWITNGMYSDFATVACRTGGEGMFGISLILVELDREGVTKRPMDCMGAKGSGTAYLEFDQVRVSKSNYIGDVTCLLRDFVQERVGLAIQANRFARICLAESIEYTRRRKAFGKPLSENPVVRNHIATMAKDVEATHAFLEACIFRVVALEREGEDWFQGILRLGSTAALLKVQATNTFENSARTAAHLHGGNSYVKGNPIERLFRETLSMAIPGGSRDVMLDAAARLALKGSL